MATYGQAAEGLYHWAARKYAGEDLGQRVYWDDAEPPPYTAADSCSAPYVSRPRIRVGRKSHNADDNGRERSFEELWLFTVFELYNICNAPDIARLFAVAADGAISREAFPARIRECESRAAEKTRAFYIRFFMPWARLHRVATNAGYWYLGQCGGSDAPNVFADGLESAALRQHYQHMDDFAVFDSLMAKGRFEAALGQAATVRQHLETLEERLTLSAATANCLIRLGRPVPAVAALDEYIHLQPTAAKAYILRATGYLLMSKYDRALDDCSQAIRLNPSLPEAYCARGKARAGLHQVLEATDDFATAERLSAPDAKPRDAGNEWGMFFDNDGFRSPGERDPLVPARRPFLCAAGFPVKAPPLSPR